MNHENKPKKEQSPKRKKKGKRKLGNEALSCANLILSSMNSPPGALSAKLTREMGDMRKSNHSNKCRHRIYDAMWTKKEPKLMMALSTTEGRERLQWKPSVTPPSQSNSTELKKPASE